MLPVTSYLLLAAGALFALWGAVFYFYWIPVVTFTDAVRLWIIASIFVSAGAITDTMNRLARVVAEEQEEFHRADKTTNLLVCLVAVLSVGVIAVFGNIISSTYDKGEKDMKEAVEEYKRRKESPY